MADKQFTQTQWTQLFRILSVWFQEINIHRALVRRYRDRRTLADAQFDDVAGLENWNINGLIVGTNTDESAKLYADSAVAASVVTLKIYKDAAKLNQVLSGTGSTATTLTLLELNDSGLAGTVGALSSALTDPDVVLNMVQDFNVRIGSTFDYEDVPEGQAKNRIKAFSDSTLLSRGNGTLTSLISNLETELSDDNGYLVGRLGSDTPNVGSLFAHVYNTVTPGEGQIELGVDTGMIAELIDAMNDQTAPAGPQTILASTASLAALQADVDNKGSVVVSSAAPVNNAPAGILHLKISSPTVGAETYTARLRLDERKAGDNGDQFIEAENNITIKKPWKDGPTGLQFTLNRATPVEIVSSSGVLINYGPITGETDSNTDVGKIFFRTTRKVGEPIWLVEMFATSSRTSALANVTVIGVTGTEAKILAGSGLSVPFTFDKDAAVIKQPGVGFFDSDLDLLVGQVNDKYEIPVTSDGKGALGELFRYLFNVEVPASPTPTIDDGVVVPLKLQRDSD